VDVLILYSYIALYWLVNEDGDLSLKHVEWGRVNFYGQLFKVKCLYT